MHREKKETLDQRQVTRWLIAGGAVGPLLFIGVFLMEGATRPGYSAWHHFVSQLSLGEQGWMQIVNFLVCGVLVLGFSFGLRRVLRPGRGSVWGPILLGVFGLALVAAGLFVTDPGLGYPLGEHGSGPQTLHGTIHGLAGLVTFSSLTAASFVMARSFAGNPSWKGWTLYSIVTGVLVAGFFVASLVVSALDQSGNAPIGLLQRISILVGWSWVALLAIRLLSH